MKTAVAVKGFIIDGDKILLVKRHELDINAPEAWEIPGGRVDHGENPMEGLAREVREETGLEINIERPFAVESFISDDNVAITMIHFICYGKGEVNLSEEHTKHEWTNLSDLKEKISDYWNVFGLSHAEKNY